MHAHTHTHTHTNIYTSMPLFHVNVSHSSLDVFIGIA